jgi:sodium transport system ATP-binding protein
MILVQDVHKSFAGATAVTHLSFDAADGRITGLLGPNGAGKTTTLKMIAGILTPDSGTIRIGGQPRGDTRQRRQTLGALLDHHALYPRLTTREHLMYFGRLRGWFGASLRQRVDDLLSTFGLSHLGDRRVGGFSQGERMRVSLGCAIVHAPDHLLLDEPTNGLDVPTVLSLRGLLRRLRDDGCCIVFSSHVLSEIAELCDRIVIIRHGGCVAEGTLDEVRNQAGAHTLEDAFIQLTGAREERPC